jgi:Fe-S-cluster containining protein
LFRVSFYWAEASDATPGGVPVELTEKITPHRLMMKGTGGSSPRCIALQGALGHNVACGIHPCRPSVCRAFEASWSEGRPNPRCDEARARFGLRPLTPEDWTDPLDRPLQPAA